MKYAMLFDVQLNRDYPNLLEHCVKHGQEVSPRGQKIKEMRPFVIRMMDPRQCIVSRPGFSRSLMWMEIAQLLAGEYNAKLLEGVSSTAAAMLNHYGAYGPRAAEQLRWVEKELQRDRDSRRAFVYIGRPDDLRLSEELDMSCTIGWQFFVRDNKLHMHVHMRSWDLVRGLSYDVPSFVSIQLAMANTLQLDVGEYLHFAGSGHVYEEHWELEAKPNDALLESTVEQHHFTWGHVQEMAQMALMGIKAWKYQDGFGMNLAPTEGWKQAFKAWERTFGER